MRKFLAQFCMIVLIAGCGLVMTACPPADESPEEAPPAEDEMEGMEHDDMGGEGEDEGMMEDEGMGGGEPMSEDEMGGEEMGEGGEEDGEEESDQ